MLIKKMVAVCAALSVMSAASLSVSADELGCAGVYFADEDWLVQYWGGEADGDGNSCVKAVENAVITGDGEYTVSAELDYPVTGLVFLALCTDIESESCPERMSVTVNSVEVNGNIADFGINGVPQWKDDGGYMRVNIYNTWTDDESDSAISAESLAGAENITVRFTVDGLEDDAVETDDETAVELQIEEHPVDEVSEDTAEEYIPQGDMEEEPVETGNTSATALLAVASWAAALALTARKRS